jgi:hypothetical protein
MKSPLKPLKNSIIRRFTICQYVLTFCISAI